MRHLGLILLVFASLAAAAERSLFDRAADALDREMEERFKAGAQSRAYKKGNNLSRNMGYRNAVFRKGMDILREEGKEEEEARSIMNEEFSKPENRGTRRRGRPGGFGGKGSQPINLPGDVCDNNEDPPVTCGTAEQENYRRIDGRCNNLGNPLWGSAGIAFLRQALPRYQDGEQAPTETCPARSRRWDGGGDSNQVSQDECCRGTENVVLPNARYISHNFHTDSDRPSHLSHMITQMGQFIDHDITLTPEIEAEHCCDNENQEGCFTLDVPSTDGFYGPLNVECLEFTRSEPFCEGSGGLRRQFNAITAFVDASNVYGSDDETAATLRAGVNGLLKIEGNDLLPYTEDTTDNADLREAGDIRVNEMPGLAAMHTVWMREHNRIAAEILSSGTVQATTAGGIDEEVYQRARVVLIAEMQKVVYDDYLPKILGENGADGFRLTLPNIPDDPRQRIDRTRYDDNQNPGIFNGFATAAYRFGHSMIQGLIQVFTHTGNPSPAGSYLLRDNFFNNKQYDLGFERILAGLLNQPAQSDDEFVSEEVTNFLFPEEEGASHGSDLVARNIHRGRDHGLAGYGAFRAACGLSIPSGDLCSWSDSARPSDIPLDRWRNLRDIYSPTPPRDMDIFTAGLAEAPEDREGNPAVGPTFACMIGQQFKNLKDGDRFFFTHGCRDHYNRRRGGGDGGHDNNDCDDVMTDNQLRTILGRSLRDILCDNQIVEKAQPDVFLVPGDGNQIVDCAQGYNRLDTSLF